MSKVIDLFLQYVKIDTQSAEESSTTPSTMKQHDLAVLLYEQLLAMGATEVFYDKEHCYVYGTIPATPGCEHAPVMGLIAHMDTSPAVTDENVQPRIVTAYDGGDIVLNREKGLILGSEEFPSLLLYVGQDLIVTDGNTLLGADDKAGVAEIMATAEYLLQNPQIRHGKIRVGFTPDEEIGAGPDHFDVGLFGADYAYTVDGGRIGELEYENFNAAGAKVTVKGRSVHPGDAKNKMKNAILILQEFQSLLPPEQNPMYTEGYEGFYHLDSIDGCVEEAHADYIIRDHDGKKFGEKKRFFVKTAEFLNEKYGANTVLVELKDSYRNMKEVIEKYPDLIEDAKTVMRELGIEPIVQPIRGGTDGARLSFMGLPCPNLGTGGHNFHGKYEYACVQSIEKNVELLVKLAAMTEHKVPLHEPERQQYFIERAKEQVEQLSRTLSRKPTCHVTTFGCQMNARDSEKLAGILKAVGYEMIEDENADFVIFNTCTVRDNANQRVYGRLGELKGFKRRNPHMKIALCGCMMQESVVVDKIRESYRFVDLIFGTHNIYKFAELLTATLSQKEMVVDIWKDTDRIVEDLPVERKYSFKSGINIMFGCNNFCSYCIVPYVRGRERSRNPKDILREVEALAADGVVEIMLLGQNVNSYGKNLEEPITFAQLLKEIEKVEGIKRIRFMTSHPKDLSEELIQVMKESKKICRHLHLPLQAGSNKILKAMNRVYTKEQYLALAKHIREEIPDMALTTDLIVGFPGETLADVEETIEMVKEVGYDNAFTFIYSPRTGTPAAAMEQVPEAVVKEGFDKLLKVVQDTARERVKRYEGQIMDALVEEVNEQDPSLLTGRLSNNTLVHFPGDASLIGKIVNVRLEKCHGFYYTGTVTEE